MRRERTFGPNRLDSTKPLEYRQANDFAKGFTVRYGINDLGLTEENMELLRVSLALYQTKYKLYTLRRDSHNPFTLSIGSIPNLEKTKKTLEQEEMYLLTRDERHPIPSYAIKRAANMLFFAYIEGDQDQKVRKQRVRERVDFYKRNGIR